MENTSISRHAKKKHGETKLDVEFHCDLAPGEKKNAVPFELNDAIDLSRKRTLHPTGWYPRPTDLQHTAEIILDLLRLQGLGRRR